MVFESIVADLLNRYLGDYIENLDSKQLNVGIWGGDVVLRNLDVRPTALDNLDLPLKLKSGSLGTLTLKIPWKNLYTEPVIATIEDLYIVATPNLGIKYDAVKEENQTQDTKQRELQRLEEQRKEKRKKPDAAEQQQQATFVEKLVTQVIKNLQVTIRDIHIRYEDEFTNPKRPFAVGVTLHSLVFQTTDEKWKPCVLKEAVKMFYKLVDLDSLTLYWNSGSKLVGNIESREETKRVMKEMIASKTSAPSGFTYMLSPISISTRLVMNPKPELDGSGFKIPKMFLSVDVKQLGFHIGKYQYQDVLEFLEAQERLRLNAVYRKYRPDLREYRGHYKQWWHFAMDCVLKDQIQRRKRNWSWEHMKSHRDLFRAYTKAWVEKRTDSSPPSHVLSTIKEAEKQLDVFNLNIARQQAELFIDRKKLKRVEEQGGVVNYLKSWWGGGKQTSSADDEADIAAKFEKAMTPEERAKLYDAIDYQENQLPTAYPKEFVENKVHVTLEKLLVVVDDNISESKTEEVMILCWQSVEANVEQRPSANAIKFDARMRTFQVEGMQGADGDGGDRPSIVSPITVEGAEEEQRSEDEEERVKAVAERSQVVIRFETNPLHRKFDQLVKLHARPLSVVYHAPSVNKLAEVFRPPESVRLKQLAATAFAKYEDIKELSATGLRHALDKRSVLKVDVSILPTIVQVPYKGVMRESIPVLVLDMGTLRINTLETADVKYDDEFYKKPENERLMILQASAYDRFNIELKTLQMLFALPGEDWMSARTKQTSSMHFLQPTGYRIQLENAAVDDPRLAKIRVMGELPDLNFEASDKKLLEMLKLLVSIPTPAPPPASPAAPGIAGELEEEVGPSAADLGKVEPSTKDRAKMKAILEATGSEADLDEEEEHEDEGKEEGEGGDKEGAKPKKEGGKKKEDVDKERAQLVVAIVLKQISIRLTRHVNGEDKPHMYLAVNNLHTKLTMRALDLRAALSLGAVKVQHLAYKAPDGEGPLHILGQAAKTLTDVPLLHVDYIQAQKSSPFFKSEFRSIEQLVRVKGEKMHLNLHQEALVDIQQFGMTLQKDLEAVTAAEKPPDPPREASRTRHPSETSSVKSSKSQARQKDQQAKKKASQVKKDQDDGTTNMKLEADMAGLEMLISMSGKVISDIQVDGLTTDVSMKPKMMEALVRLKAFSITDPFPEITYNKILSVAGEEVFSLRFVQYNRTESEVDRMGLDEVDMEVVLSLAEMRFVFLNLHVSRLMAWLGPFQEQAVVAADQAAVAAQERARNAAVAIREMRRTTKMKLSVDLDAPVIIVPQSSRSDEALIADFGRLVVGNRFTTSPIRAGSTKTVATFDNITVQLRNMKLSRVILGDDRWSVVAECRLLEPVSFELTAIRNLSFAYYKDKPEVAVVGRLPLLKVCASSEDYGVAMKTLTGNLSEAVPVAQKPAPAPPPVKKPATSSNQAAAEGGKERPARDVSRSQSQAQTVTTAVVEATSGQPTENRTKLEFAFEIECIAAQLYDGTSNLLAGIAERDNSKALALVEIKTIAVRGHMTENGSMQAKVYLHSFIMDDSRVNRAGITRLMDKKGGPSATNQNMIDIIYTKDVLDAGRTDGITDTQMAEVVMRPFFFFVCPEFLGALGRFFTVSKSEQEQAMEERVNKNNKESGQQQQQEEKEKEKPVPPAATPGTGSMNVNVSIQDPEIALLEDTTSPDTTKAIILKFRADLLMTSDPEKMVVNGGVKGLSVVSSYFAQAKRQINPLKVLSPCDIELSAEMPKDAGQRIRVVFSPLQLRISPNVIGLLSAVAAHMAAPQEQSARDKRAQRIARQQVWDQKAIADADFWFLNEALKADEAVEDLFTPVEDELIIPDVSKQDQCTLEMDKIELTLEADAGAGTVPMIHLTTTFNATVSEWTRKLNAEAALKLEMWYYNERYNAWEPLIEPLIEEDGTRRPWQLETYVTQNSAYDSEDTEVVIQPPKMSIVVFSGDNLQLTVTKTFLDLTTELGDAFARAAKRIEPKKPKGVSLDYEWAIQNDSGLDVQIQQGKGTFSISKDSKEGELPYYQMTELVCNSGRRKIGGDDDKQPLLLNLKVPSMNNTSLSVDVARAEKRLFSLARTGEMWFLVVDTVSSFGNKLVRVRSPIKFINHLPLDMEIYYRADGNVESAGVALKEDGEFSPPLHGIHTTTGELMIQPANGPRYEMGRQAVKWRDFGQNKNWQLLIECPSVDGDQSKSYYIQASIQIEDAYFENTLHKYPDVPCYTVHLGAPTLFRNALPYPLEISAPGIDDQVLNGGESASLCAVVPGKSISLKIKADVEWTCHLEIAENFEELTQHTFHGRRSESNGKMEMDLGLRTSRRLGTQEMTLYCPFWMVNKTGLPLSYKDHESISGTSDSSVASSISPCSCFKGSAGRRHRETEHVLTVFDQQPGSDDPLLFTFSGDAFFAKNKKACLKVGASEWSDKFPLDVVGSAGKITCKGDSGKEFEVSVNIQLSYSGLTKICTFTPFYMVDNRTNADVEVRQSALSEQVNWTRVARDQCLGFWPEKKSKRMQMTCRYVDDDQSSDVAASGPAAESQAFPFTESFECLVVMPNEFIGVYVSTHISDNAVVVVLEEYQDGMAPVLLVNETDDVEVYYRQKDIDQVSGLPHGYCALFSWSSVLVKRQLLWSCGDAKNMEDQLIKDGMGEVQAKKDLKVYWVSFLNGRQRVLLFTQDLAVATTASKPYELERIDQQFTVSIQAVNISLINNLIGVEIASMAVTSSGVIWEYKKRRFRAFSIKDNRRLEEAFIKYNNDKNEGKKVKSRVDVGNRMQVDFEEMKQYKPKELEIRRSFQSGFWLQYMQSQHEQQVHLKVNHFQIDNQLPVAVFQTFFAPVPPAKSVAADSIPKPLAELSFIMRKMEHSNIPQIKYFMVLVQEMAVQADKGFINALIEMFTNETAIVYEPEQYEKDLDITRQSLTQLAAVTSSTEQRAYYEYLHFSPMKIHLSFSQGGSDGGDAAKATPIHSEVLNLLLKSVGVTLTEIQDVQFKLAYLERKAVFMNRQQLISEAVSHYTKQAIKQLYVLVLGLDIMGNPFGLIRDLSTGVETFFYEPIQGAIQGPEEFAEGLALGLKGLFGGAVGGAAGAVSRITGTLGKGLAALTLDDEYQKKRQQMLNRRPANVQEGFAQGAKGLAMGFVEGVTGVFTKPLEGAKKGGVGGFAKGVGKGVVGLVTRPVSGVVDFASGTFQAVKRVADTSEEVKKLRPARFIEPDKIIRPFSLQNAAGNQLVQEASKGKYATTDVYVAHAPATAEYNVIITDRRIMMVSKTLGALEVDWQYTWKELAEAPSMAGNELRVKLKEAKKKLFGSSSQGKRIKFADQALGEMLAARAREAFARDHGSPTAGEDESGASSCYYYYRSPMVLLTALAMVVVVSTLVFVRYYRRR